MVEIGSVYIRAGVDDMTGMGGPRSAVPLEIGIYQA